MKKVAFVVALLLAVVFPTSAAALGNTPDNTWMTNGKVRAMTRIGNVIYIGGKFSRVKNRSGASVVVHNLAAINSDTGQPITSWRPNADDQVFALHADGNRIYVGGDFTHLNGIGRARFAALDAASGAVTSFTAGADRRVYSIRTTSTAVYVGGSFTRIGGVGRRHIAAVTKSGGRLTWHAGTDQKVRELEISGPFLYFVGDFTRVRTTSRDLVARVSLSTGAVDHPWRANVRIFTDCSPTFGGHVCQWGDEIEVVEGHVFVGFCGPSNRVESFDPVTGNRQWRMWTSGDPKSMAIWGDGNLIIGGHFRRMHFEGSTNEFFLKFLAKLAYNGVPDTNWRVTLDETEHEWDGMYALQADGTGTGSHLWVGGAFKALSGVPQDWLARFTM